MIQSISAKAAKDYFTDGLSKSDYYINDQELVGTFRGKLAGRLSIEGIAEKAAFNALCENQHPATGKRLTPRKLDRRTIGYDINFHCPKSVSLLHVLSKDDHILKAFQSSVNEIMTDIEADAKTRVRKNGQDNDRDTGELLWADFIHQTARPTKDSAPDPHLHAHCYTFNLTWDDAEKQYKAGQFRDIKRDMPYYQAKFYKNFSDKLSGLGYGIIKTETSFEIKGVPASAIELFSKRTQEINRLAQQKNIKDADERAALGKRTRSKKQKGLTMTQLKDDWKRQIKECGLADTKAVIRHDLISAKNKATYQDCISHAVDHRFERNSVAQDRRILETAFLFAIGKEHLKAGEIEKRFSRDTSIIKVREKTKTYCTTQKVIAQERQLIRLAVENNGTLAPLYRKPPVVSLSAEQQKAANHVLTSKDRVTAIEGRAGTGKTTLMKETIRLMEDAGKQVTVVAPTSQAARGVLKSEGFEHAETVAKLLHSPNLQKGLKDQVLWVDEAGLLGTQEMSDVLSLAARQGTRVVLSGDTRQHSAVARGDALRVLIDLAGVSTVSVSTIYRQKHEGYKKAVQALSRQEVARSFSLLDDLQAIREVPIKKQKIELASNYVRTLKNGKTALIVCPTHKHGEQVTQSVRQQLKYARLIGNKEKSFKRLVNRNMTEADKADTSNYRKGDVLQFSQNVPGIKRGSAWTVEDVGDRELLLSDCSGTKAIIAVERKNNFDVFKQTEIPLAKGDLIRLTRNGFDNNKKRFNNGQMLRVESINKKGCIIAQTIDNKSIVELPEDYGHLAHGYCMTSHASQGKTVDEVFIYQPSETFPATDMKQFYVSVSRGRDKVHIYTDDKKALIDHASKMRDRQSGLELVGMKAMAETITGQKTAAQLSNKHIPFLGL